MTYKGEIAALFTYLYGGGKNAAISKLADFALYVVT